MQGYEVFTPAITRGFGLGQLETVLKSAMQSAGVEGRPSVLLIEDHHITSDDILETINSLLSAGETTAVMLLISAAWLAYGTKALPCVLMFCRVMLTLSLPVSAITYTLYSFQL